MFIPVTDELYGELIDILEPGETVEDAIRRLIKKSKHIEEFFKEQFEEYMEHDIEEADR